MNPSHGESLLELTDVFDLVWLTTWNDRANEIVSPKIGLSSLPVLHNSEAEYIKHCRVNAGDKLLSRIYFKSWFVANGVSNNTPFVWVDDQHGENDVEYLSRFFGPNCFSLYGVSDRVGLVDDDFTALRVLGERWVCGA